MPVVLYRVDERLIHGQVVVGWGAVLHPDRIVVVDDELAASDWEQELYVMGLPSNIETMFARVRDARQHLDEWRGSARRTILLTRDIDSMLRLAGGGLLAGEEVNIGGIHDAPGRHPVLPYVFLDAGEAEELKRLSEERVTVGARDLPTSRAVPLERLVGDGGS